MTHSVIEWRTCRLPGCFEVFRARRAWSKYCSKSCKNKAYVARLPQIMMVKTWLEGSKVHMELEIDAKYITENPIVLTAKATSALVKRVTNRGVSDEVRRAKAAGATAA